MWAGDPAPIQTTSWREERAVHQALRDGTLRKRRDRTGLEAGRVDDLVGAGDAHELSRDRGADRRLVGAPVAGHEREDEGTVADEHERLDDLR